MYSTPGPRKGSGLPPGPTSLQGVAKTRRSQGSAVLQAAGLLPKASPVHKRIGTPTWALGARRLGLQEEGRSSVLVGGGVSALPPPFQKGDSDSTWTRMEKKQPRRLLALREGFLPAKNPSTSFSGCPRAPPWPIKGGQNNQGREIGSPARHKQEGRKTRSAPSR